MSAPGTADPVPAVRELLRIESPGFHPRPPEVVHPERIPPDIHDAMVATRIGAYPARPVRVMLLHDALVLLEGLVFDRDGLLFEPSRAQHSDIEVEWAAARVAAIRAGAEPPPPFHDETLVLAKKRGAHNYGHWLVEILPRLALCLDRLAAPRPGALLHDVSDPALGGAMIAALQRLGVPPGAVRVSDGHPVRVRRLLVVDGLSDHGVYLSPLVVPVLRRLAGEAGGRGRGGRPDPGPGPGPSEPSGPSRVFLLRGAGRHRDFADPDRAARVAAAAGYTVLDPGTMSFDAQLSALRSARVVAGVMGAALTNLVFAPPGARVLAFAPDTMPDTFFWFLCQHFGHFWREVRCLTADRTTDGTFYDRSLLIDDDELRRHLDAA